MYSTTFPAQPETQLYYQKPFLDEIGDYLTRVASAVVSLVKRILCIPDQKTPQDLFWAAQRCGKLEMENLQLRGRIDFLRNHVSDLQWKTTYSIFSSVFIEAILFVAFAPLYIISLPVTCLRGMLYFSMQNVRL